MSVELTSLDIREIDKWLERKGIKYIDIRYELVDHLVSEYEQLENYPDLESFLRSKITWCRKVDKKMQRTVNLGQTKALFKKFIGLFVNGKYLLLLAILGGVLFYLEPFLTPKTFRNIFLIAYFSPICYQLYLMIYSGLGTKMKKQAVSAVYLINIFSLPQLPIYFLGLFKDELMNPYFYIPFCSLGFLFNIAAILFFYEKREILLKEFEVLKKQFK